ncbi:MAG: Spx/MgsR family RNA polymerase-binding regulatory protein [Candidatus Omnitrophota bacterium]
MMKFYGYNQCTTCKKAKKFLEDRKILYDDFDITKNPPSKKLLNQILATGEYSIRQLFNTSGQLYREMNIKEKISELSQTELLELLSQNGRLIKRPIITDGSKTTVGFNESQLKEKWK